MAKLLIVGEAYGARESLFDHPFVGSSGKELAEQLAAAELAPPLGIDFPSELEMMAYWRRLKQSNSAPIAVTNVFNVRPTNNDITEFFGPKTGPDVRLDLPPLRPGKYLKAELSHHLETLEARIEAEAPDLILALGNTACWAILGQSGISAIRGTLRRTKDNLKVIPTYHPAAVLRQWNLRTIVLADLTKAAEHLRGSTVRRERWLLVDPTLEEIAEWSTRPAEYYAVDIENKPQFIEMIGFARSPDDAMVVPFFNPDVPDGSYWPTPGQEHMAWKLVAKLLASPIPKLFQNGIYDLTHLLRAGLRPQMCLHDTMLLHHALYPEMLKGLGFLASIYVDEEPWKLMRGKGNNLKRDE